MSLNRVQHIMSGLGNSQGPRSFKNAIFRELPPGTKPIHAGKNSWGINFCVNACGACILRFSHSREYRKIFLREHFPHISQILEGIHLGANTCRACIRTRASTGNNSWQIIYVLVSCQGVSADPL